MKKNKHLARRALSLLLALIMTFSLCPSVMADESFCVFKNKNHHFPLKISHIRVFWGKDMLAIPK